MWFSLFCLHDFLGALAVENSLSKTPAVSIVPKLSLTTVEFAITPLGETLVGCPVDGSFLGNLSATGSLDDN